MTRPFAKLNSTKSGFVFENQFLREILSTERLRAAILVAIIIVTSLLLMLISTLDQSEFTSILRKSGSEYSILIIISALGIYEAALWLFLGFLIRSDRRPPLSIRYLNVLIETSIPTIMMVVFSQAFEPIYALVSLAPLAYFLLIILSTLRLEFWLCFFTGFISAIQYFFLAWYLLEGAIPENLHPMFGSFGYYTAKSFFILLAGYLAGLVTQQVKKSMIRSLKSVEERNHIETLFGQHASPEVVSELVNNPDTTSTRRYACVMFVDIRGFTSFAEKQTAEETVAFLNTIFEHMIKCITKNQGIVHQLLGDGLMAIFGVPISTGTEANNSVNAALQILQKVKQQINDGEIPFVRLGIGIHAGEVIAGTIGSSLHKEYKVTGDVVNLAARIEQLNKEYSTQILVSGEVWNALNKKHPDAVSRGMVQVRGRSEAIEIFELAS